MNKINLTKLRKTINKMFSPRDIITINEYDFEYDENMLYLECLSGVTDNYERFATIHEDGVIDMKFGSANILYNMEDVEEYYDAETGGVLPEFDNYETVVKMVLKCVRQDIEDERSFLEDIEYIINKER